MNLLGIVADDRRIFGLDLIRAFAILFVVLGHGAYLLPDKIRRLINLLPFPDGVTVFFVLSGFLIGGILIKLLISDHVSFKTLMDFWTRRWLRTIPLYYFILIVIFILSIKFVEGFNAAQYFNYFIFSQNFASPHPTFFVEAWSLSVEEWFYLLTPAIMFSLIRAFKFLPRHAIKICLILIFVSAVIIRYYRYRAMPVMSEEIWDTVFRKQVVTRLDSLMFGVVGAYFSIYHSGTWVKHKNRALYLGLMAIVLIAIIPRWLFPTSRFYYCNISFLITPGSILLILPFCSQLKVYRGIFYHFITYTSLISYSMYLIHASIVMIFIVSKISFLQSTSTPVILVRFLLFWFLTYLISILLYKYFELPILHFRDKIFKAAKFEHRSCN